MRAHSTPAPGYGPLPRPLPGAGRGGSALPGSWWSTFGRRRSRREHFLGTRSDSVDDLLQGILHFTVVEAEDAEPSGGKHSVPLCIAIGGSLVHRSVYFDDEPGGVAVEVCDQPIDHVLPTKMEPVQSVPPQSAPETLLRGSHLPPQFLRPLRLHLPHRLPHHDSTRLHRSIYLWPGLYRQVGSPSPRRGGGWGERLAWSTPSGRSPRRWRGGRLR